MVSFHIMTSLSLYTVASSIYLSFWNALSLLFPQRFYICCHIFLESEKAMAPHSSLDWRIPGTAEPGGMQQHPTRSQAESFLLPFRSQLRGHLLTETILWPPYHFLIHYAILKSFHKIHLYSKLLHWFVIFFLSPQIVCCSWHMVGAQ